MPVRFPDIELLEPRGEVLGGETILGVSSTLDGHSVSQGDHALRRILARHRQ